MTVPLARYVAQYYPELAFPFKRYHIAKVYRGERPQKGHFREFYQCDIDIIGDGDLDLANDAEIPSVIYEVFRRLGFSNFTIRLNNRKILNGFFMSLGIGEKAVDIMRAVDKLEKIGIPTAIYLEEVKPAKIFKYADRIGVPFIAIIGDDEIKENVVSLKNMETKEQKKLSLEEVYDIVA